MHAEYRIQLAALRRKLTSCARDIGLSLNAADDAINDPAKINLFYAKLASAEEARTQFIEAWDRVVLIHIKLGTPDDFPDQEDSELRDAALNSFHEAKAIEISFKQHSTQTLNATFGNVSKPSISLLDKIKLPNFNGDVREWARFRDIFSSMVDKDTSLEPVTKLYLLRDSLAGDALSLVNKFDITAANYPLAWKALEDAYENPRVLASAYLEQILGFKMPNRPGLADFQNFLTDVADNVSALQALRLEDAPDKILALTMLRTLDSQTRHKFEIAQIGSGFPTTDTVVKFVRNQCQALKLSGSQQSPSTLFRPLSTASGSDTAPRFPRRSSPRFNSRSFLTSSCSSSSQNRSSDRQQSTHRSPGKNKRADPPVCPHCNERHFLSRCPVFTGMSVNERCEFAAQWKGCGNCLSPTHKIGACKSRWSCRICGERHHSLLHQRKATGQQSASAPCPPAATSHCGHTGSNQETEIPNVDVVLGTAAARVRDSTGREHRVRLLLDSGSHRSFITRRCCDALQLNTSSTCTLITGLGGNSAVTTEGTAKFTLLSLHGRGQLTVTAAVLPDKITAPLPQRPLPRQIYEAFRNLRLADPLFHQPQDVDILIGADYYNKVVTGSFENLRRDLPSTLPTIFGDVVMGPYAIPTSPCLFTQFRDRKSVV